MGLFARLFRRSRPADRRVASDAPPLDRAPRVAAPPTARTAPPVPARVIPPPGGGYAVLDVETTGLSADVDRVVEIAIVHLDRAGRILGQWTTRVDPEGPMGANHIHGITDADVRGAPRFADLVPHLNGLLAGWAVAAHSVRFDLAFLRAEYARAGWRLPWVPSLCTLDASRYYQPQLDGRRLVDCCAAAGIGLTAAHSALADTRAAAALLSCYLDPRVGRPPRPEDLQLPGQAATVTWPTGPAGAPLPPPPSRPARRQFPVKAVAPTLMSTLTGLSLGHVLDPGAPATAVNYLDFLAGALQAGAITGPDPVALAQLGALYDLRGDALRAVNTAFLLALAEQAVDDGRISHPERAELHAVAVLLTLDADLVARVLHQADHARAARLSADLKPLPPGWGHGDPLHVGDRVAFTGCDPTQRAGLEQRATSLGVRVVSAVTARTVLLVTDDSYYGIKAADAARLTTRVVHPDRFAVLLRHLQPTRNRADVTSPGPTPGPARPNVAAATPPRSAPDPTVVRQWAHHTGLPVGTRGRLPADVLAAYQEAHQYA